MLESLESRDCPSSVSGLSVTSGPTAGGPSVEIFGSGFTGATSVSFGGASVSYYNFTVINDGQIDLPTLPAHTAGTVDVTVTTPDGTSPITSADQFTYEAPPPVPTVGNLSVSSGPATGGTVLQINGTGFTGATAVNFGGATASSFTVVSDTAISITAPAGAAGTTVDVTVTTPNGTSALYYDDQFTYSAPPAPSVNGLSVWSGPATGGTALQINGTGFTGATAVSFGGAAASSFTVLSDTAISATAPAGAAGTTVDVTVTTPNGTSALYYDDQFSYNAAPPAVTGVTPDSGPATGGYDDVDIFGSGFTNASSVSFGNASVSYYYFTVVNDSQIDVSWLPAQAPGTVDVTVTTPKGTSAVTAADQFAFQAPTTVGLTASANPSTFGQALTLTATVSGSAGTPTGTVEFDDGTTILGTTTLSGGQATFDASALAAGTHAITATYYGDDADADSTSATLNLTVQQATTTTTLTSGINQSDTGQAVTFTAEVDGQFGGAPTGTVTFMSGATTLGTAILSPGGNGSQATLTVSTLLPGTTAVTAVYSGDANFTTSSSTALNQSVEDNGAYIWTGAVSEDWDTASNWLMDGVAPQYAPTDASDVIFSGVGETDPNCYTDGTVSVNSLTMDAPYAGTLTLKGALDVAGTMDVEGGNISQPGGVGVSDISVMGSFNWVAGAINTVGNTLGNIYLFHTASIGGTSLTIGDTILLDGSRLGLLATLNFNTTGSLTFIKNAGITLSNGAQFYWKSTGNLVTNGTGVIENDGGVFEKIPLAGNVVTSDLPYIGTSGTLNVQNNTLEFDKAGPSGASVQLISGKIELGVANVSGATLGVLDGLIMQGGSLGFAGNETSKITQGAVDISGGTVGVSGSSVGKLYCDGLVTMTGGTYLAEVNLSTAASCDVWDSATGFDFPVGNKARLVIFAQNAPAVLPAGRQYKVITTLAPGSIAGDFGVKQLGIVGGRAIMARTDAIKQNYLVLT